MKRLPDETSNIHLAIGQQRIAGCDHHNSSYPRNNRPRRSSRAPCPLRQKGHSSHFWHQFRKRICSIPHTTAHGCTRESVEYAGAAGHGADHIDAAGGRRAI